MYMYFIVTFIICFFSPLPCSPTTVNMYYNSSPWQQTSPSFYRPHQAPTLELYGNAISLNRVGGSGTSRKSSARRRPMGQTYNYR